MDCSPNIHSCVDTFTIESGVITIAGWAFCDEGTIASMKLQLDSGNFFDLAPPAMESADVAIVHGAVAKACRFRSKFTLSKKQKPGSRANLHILCSNNKTLILHDVPLMDVALRYAIDSFSVYKDSVAITGWAVHLQSKITSMKLRLPGNGEFAIDTPSLPSPDVANVHGPSAQTCRFETHVLLTRLAGVYKQVQPETFLQAELIVTTANGKSHIIRGLTQPGPHDNANWVLHEFLQILSAKPTGSVLEVGSRARSGVVHKSMMPDGWSYVGLDVLAGENVNVVGDAHQLSKLFPTQRFDAVVAFSVLEHLLMPWKFAIELNKVLNIGAVGFFTTHQSWPLHDAPWDFWRFSDQAWSALFNSLTGFEIIRVFMSEPGVVVARRWHPVVHFQEQPIYLSSVVMFRKISETQLTWPVEVSDIVATHYPATSSSRDPDRVR